MSERDATRPIQCVSCGRSFASPRWFGLQGPLCAACHDRLRREQEVSRAHQQQPSGLRAWLRGVFHR